MRRADLWPLNPAGELFAYLMIESPEAVRNIREILDVPGIGGVLIGVNDLSINLGVGRATRSGQPLAPEARAAVRHVLAACLAKRVLCSIIGGGDREELVEMGFFRMPR
jgi:4-hydroxy-2-oxoheptanedioate aldolase